METVFLSGLFLALALLFGWSFRYLPGERWQIIGSVPTRKHGDGRWECLNLTYYGLFNAFAYTFAAATAFVLMASLGAAPLGIGVTAVVLLGVCMPASKLIARIVERKKATFSVGGAAFVGIVLGPWLTAALKHLGGDRLHLDLPVMAAMAALAIAYAFGEGIGRLACISFGCCYGRPLTTLPPAWQRVLAPLCFIFEGKTRKIAYASGLDGQRVIPIQAITAVLYTLSGFIGTWLFLMGLYRTALLEALLFTQLWRFFSEFLRADFRGAQKISAYQIMGLTSCVYALGVVFLFPAVSVSGHPPLLGLGLAQLWQPEVLLFLQGLALVAFLYTGRSQVTGATVRFHVRPENV
jgi:prolipoprotein diacylglyceryltransferase